MYIDENNNIYDNEQQYLDEGFSNFIARTKLRIKAKLKKCDETGNYGSVSSDLMQVARSASSTKEVRLLKKDLDVTLHKVDVKIDNAPNNVGLKHYKEFLSNNYSKALDKREEELQRKEEHDEEVYYQKQKYKEQRRQDREDHKNALASINDKYRTEDTDIYDDLYYNLLKESFDNNAHNLNESMYIDMVLNEMDSDDFDIESDETPGTSEDEFINSIKPKIDELRKTGENLVKCISELNGDEQKKIEDLFDSTGSNGARRIIRSVNNCLVIYYLTPEKIVANYNRMYLYKSNGEVYFKEL
jgi:hypothetical protein